MAKLRVIIALLLFNIGCENQPFRPGDTTCCGTYMNPQTRQEECRPCGGALTQHTGLEVFVVDSVAGIVAVKGWLYGDSTARPYHWVYSMRMYEGTDNPKLMYTDPWRSYMYTKRGTADTVYVYREYTFRPDTPTAMIVRLDISIWGSSTYYWQWKDGKIRGTPAVNCSQEQQTPFGIT